MTLLIECGCSECRDTDVTRIQRSHDSLDCTAFTGCVPPSKTRHTGGPSRPDPSKMPPRTSRRYNSRDCAFASRFCFLGLGELEVEVKVIQGAHGFILAARSRRRCPR